MNGLLPIPELKYFFSWIPWFCIFQQTIQLDCFTFGHFSEFLLIVVFYFRQISPPLNECFKRCFKSFLSPFQCKRLSQRSLHPPAYATDLSADLHQDASKIHNTWVADIFVNFRHYRNTVILPIIWYHHKLLKE